MNFRKRRSNYFINFWLTFYLYWNLISVTEVILIVKVIDLNIDRNCLKLGKLIEVTV